MAKATAGAPSRVDTVVGGVAVLLVAGLLAAVFGPGSTRDSPSPGSSPSSRRIPVVLAITSTDGQPLYVSKRWAIGFVTDINPDPDNIVTDEVFVERPQPRVSRLIHWKVTGEISPGESVYLRARVQADSVKAGRRINCSMHVGEDEIKAVANSVECPFDYPIQRI